MKLIIGIGVAIAIAAVLFSHGHCAKLQAMGGMIDGKV